MLTILNTFATSSATPSLTPTMCGLFGVVYAMYRGLWQLEEVFYNRLDRYRRHQHRRERSPITPLSHQEEKQSNHIFIDRVPKPPKYMGTSHAWDTMMIRQVQAALVCAVSILNDVDFGERCSQGPVTFLGRSGSAPVGERVGKYLQELCFVLTEVEIFFSLHSFPDSNTLALTRLSPPQQNRPVVIALNKHFWTKYTEVYPNDIRPLAAIIIHEAAHICGHLHPPGEYQDTSIFINLLTISSRSWPTTQE